MKSSSLQLQPWTKDDFPPLLPLLTESAGYEVSLQDELDYYVPENSRNWFFAVADEKPYGFIRAFQFGSWGRGELFVFEGAPRPLALKKQLLQKFLEHSRYPEGFRLRFELDPQQSDLVSLIEDAGFGDRREYFLHCECDLRKSPSLETPAIRLATSEDISSLIAVFSNLHAVTGDEITEWTQNKNIYVTETDGAISSAADVRLFEKTAEVVRIATRSDFLKRGSAQRLLCGLHQMWIRRGIQKVFLKVDQTKQPARALYKKLNYQHLPDKDQIWLSKIF